MSIRGNPRLVAAEGSSGPFELGADEVAIGSAPDNDLVVGDPTVSRRHARITRLDKRLRLTDLGATNGTYVNGVRVSEPVDLNDGDEVRLGAAVFRFATGVPARSPGSRVITVITAIALVFAAGFAITLHIANFDRLEEAAELSPATSAVDRRSVHGGVSIAASPAAVATAALEAPTPSATSVESADSASSPAADRLWLDPLNRYRRSAGLQPVTANPRHSHGDYLHSRYIV